jgi:exopolysaccharide production protein ExoZ
MNVAWSLSYEWFFYLALPIVVGVTALRSVKPQVRIVIFITIVLLFWGATLAFPDVFFMRSNPIRASHIKLIMFFCGMAIADLMHIGVSYIPRWLAWSSLGLMLAGLAVPFVIGYNGFRTITPNPDTARVEAIISGSLFIGYGLVVLCALAGHNPVNHLFRFTPLRWLGNMSYSFYLVHGLPMHVVAVIVGRRMFAGLHGASLYAFILVLLPVTFVVTSACSTLLFALIEKPFSLKVRKPVTKLEAELQQTAP